MSEATFSPQMDIAETQLCENSISNILNSMFFGLWSAADVWGDETVIPIWQSSIYILGHTCELEI